MNNKFQWKRCGKNGSIWSCDEPSLSKIGYMCYPKCWIVVESKYLCGQRKFHIIFLISRNKSRKYSIKHFHSLAISFNRLWTYSREKVNLMLVVSALRVVLVKKRQSSVQILIVYCSSITNCPYSKTFWRIGKTFSPWPIPIT